MPIDTRSRIIRGSALQLPPPFRLITLREVGDAFAHARAVADEEGAGCLVYVGRFDLAEFAVVLEPEEALRTARRAFYAGCVALADALSVLAPPAKPIEFVWPDTITVDHGSVGGARLAWPAGALEDVRPDWLVFGAMIRTVAMGDDEPGLRPLSATLEEEGFDDVGSARLVEGFARHLMTAFDRWREDGFEPVAQSYLARLPPQKDVRHDIGENGDLLVQHAGRAVTERRDFALALAHPTWLDPHTGGPRR